MKLQLKCSDKGLKSESLKRIAEEMSTRLGYLVVRTTKENGEALQLRWGAPSNKLDQYQKFKGKGLSALEFTQDQAIAGDWFNKGSVVIGRKLLESYEGKGIEVFSPTEAPDPAKILECKLFTKFIPKEREFRVHVFKGKPVITLEKKKKKEWEGPTSDYVKNTQYGYVFCQEDLVIAPPLQLRINILASQASTICASDFQGVDIGYHKEKDNLFVIEVNSAPGIEGSNVGRYCDLIQAHMQKFLPKQHTWPL